MFIRKVILAIALLAISSAQTLAGATLDRVTKSGVLTNVLVNDYPPFSYLDENNTLAGFDIDVAQAVADKLGVKLRLETPGWETIVSGKWEGRWDISIGSMTPTKERAEVLSFPVQYYSSPAVLVVHKDETRIADIKDISGRQVGVGTGSSYEAYLQKKLVIETPGAQPVAFPFDDVTVVPGDVTVNFQNLALGPGVRLDAIIDNLATSQERIDKTHAFKIIGKPLYGEPNWVATEKGDAEWDARVAETIKALRSDGTLAKISNKWFGTDITAGDF